MNLRRAPRPPSRRRPSTPRKSWPSHFDLVRKPDLVTRHATEAPVVPGRLRQGHFDFIGPAVGEIPDAFEQQADEVLLAVDRAALEHADLDEGVLLGCRRRPVEIAALEVEEAVRTLVWRKLQRLDDAGMNRVREARLDRLEMLAQSVDLDLCHGR